jgi:hypothetical protein
VRHEKKISPFVPGRVFAAAPSLSSAAVASAALRRQVSGKCSAMWGSISGKVKLALACLHGLRFSFTENWNMMLAMIGGVLQLNAVLSIASVWLGRASDSLA